MQKDAAAITKQRAPSDGNEENPVLLLEKAAETFDQILKRYTKSLGKLQFVGVDDRVLDFVNADLRLSNRMKQLFSELAARLEAIAEWNETSKSLPEPTWNELLYSFWKGFEFHPSAGPERLVKAADTLQSEGKQLVTEYLDSLGKLNEALREIDDSDIKELELRQYLAKKYGTEFQSLEADD